MGSAFDLTWIMLFTIIVIPDHSVRSYCKIKPACRKGKKGGKNSPMRIDMNDALFSVHLFLMADWFYFFCN